MLVNAKIGYDWENLGIFAYGRNLLDEEYITARNARLPNILKVGSPLEFGVEVRASF